MLRRLFLASLVAAVVARALIDRPAFIAQEVDHDYYTVQHQWQAEIDSEHVVGLGAEGGHPLPPHFPEHNHPQPPGPPNPPPPSGPHPPPHFPGHHPPTSSNGTIYSTLRESPEFSRLFKVVNISDQIVALLNDSSKNLTFFALPNHAIPHPPPHHRLPRDLKMDSVQADLSLVDLIYHLESIQIEDSTLRRPSEEEIKKIVTVILSYHTIPSRRSLFSLKKNSTYPTTLSHVFGALNDNALRLRVGAGLPFARVNFYSDIVKPDIGTQNGVIHAINHPLLPPPSVFQSIFIFQGAFATFSSVVQRTGVTDALDFKFVPDSDVDLAAAEGSPVVTVFAPTNKAFASLPRRLQFFLFSPPGERVLKKLVQYHVVPDVAFYSDWWLNSTSETDLGEFDVASALTDQDWTALEPVLGSLEHDCADGYPTRFESRLPPPPLGFYEENPPQSPTIPHYGRFGPKPDNHPRHPPLPKPKLLANLTLPTAFEGHSLNALVVRIPIKLPIPGHHEELGHITKVIVNGQPVAAYDGPALNGALHVVNKLISPRRGKKEPKGSPTHLLVGTDRRGRHAEDLGDWEDWEDWLPAWAEE